MLQHLKNAYDLGSRIPSGVRIGSRTSNPGRLLFQEFLSFRWFFFSMTGRFGIDVEANSYFHFDWR